MSIGIALMAVQAVAQPATAPSASPPARGARGGMLPVVQRGMNMIDQTRQIAAGLNLTAEQTGKLDAVLQTARQELSGMTQQLLRVQPPQRREQVREFLETLPGKIKPLLTEAQGKTFDRQFANVLRALPETPPPVVATPVPSTQPGATPARVGIIIERLSDYVNQLGLDDDQKAQVQRLFADTRQELLDLRGATEAATPAVEEKSRKLVEDLRTQLAAVLQPRQAEQLREMIAQGAANPQRSMDGMGGMAPANAAANRVASAPADEAAKAQEIPLIEMGKVAPDFSLKRLDGQTLQLSSLKGRYVLLIFGSYTSPTFRSRSAALEQLKLSYGSRLNPVIVYTRETYPVGEWTVERNKEEGIAFDQPKDMDARLAMARQARTSLKITVPMVMDLMDDSTAIAYGAVGCHAAILIDREGKVAARQKWFEPYAMRRLIDEAMKSPATD